MVDHTELKVLLSKLNELREEHDADGKPKSLTALLNVLDGLEGKKERYVVMSTLATEYVLLGMIDEAERSLQRLVTEFAEDTLAWITFAEYYLYTNPNYPKAASTIDHGVQVARRTGQFLRQAYNTRARIARKLGDYTLLEETLRALTEYKPPSGAHDVRYEEDFLKAIPEGVVDPHVVDKYRATVVAAKDKPAG